MPPKFKKSFAERLNRISDLVVHEAVDGEEIKNGRVFVAPGGYHMYFKSDKVRGVQKSIIKLTKDAPVNNFRPSVDVMMRSVADGACKNSCVSVLLTGMGEDGREGVRAIKKAGGYSIAQSPETAVINSMPDSIIKAGLVDEVLPPDKIPEKLIRLVQ